VIHNRTLLRTRQRRGITAFPSDELLRPVQAAMLLNVTPRCLQDWRLKGIGPRFIRMTPKLVQYRRSDLEKFIEESAA
jgi:helix-turn-helix protein